MQSILSHEKVQSILRKKSPGKKSITITSLPEIKYFHKDKIKEKVKLQLKNNKTEAKEEATNMIKNFSETLNESPRKEQVLHSEMEKQEESFKSRLQMKKLVRVNSNKNIAVVVIRIIYNFLIIYLE